jgi:hypothetical protein
MNRYPDSNIFERNSAWKIRFFGYFFGVKKGRIVEVLRIPLRGMFN